MSDYVKVHAKVYGSQYQKALRQIADNPLDCEDNTRQAIKGLTKDLNGDYGAEPIEFLKLVGLQFRCLPTEPLLLAIVDWCEEADKISRAAQQTGGKKRAMALAKRVADRSLQKIRQGERPGDIQLSLLQDYDLEVYDAQFESPASIADGYLDNRDSAAVIKGLEKMRPFIKEEIAKLAAGQARNASKTPLRLSPRKREKLPRDFNYLHVDILDVAR
jgi:hypothetical protein